MIFLTSSLLLDRVDRRGALKQTGAARGQGPTLFGGDAGLYAALAMARMHENCSFTRATPPSPSGGAYAFLLRQGPRRGIFARVGFWPGRRASASPKVPLPDRRGAAGIIVLGVNAGLARLFCGRGTRMKNGLRQRVRGILAIGPDVFLQWQPRKPCIAPQRSSQRLAAGRAGLYASGTSVCDRSGWLIRLPPTWARPSRC